MAKKKKLTIWDLGRLEKTPVALPTGDAVPVGTLKQYRERLSREEQEAAAKAEQERIEQAEQARIAELSSPATRAVSFFWSQPVQEIRTNISADVYDNGASLVPFDAFGAFETGDAGDAFDSFNADLVNRGITLYRGGLVRLQLYLKARGVSLTFNNYQTALDRLASLNCFEPHELEGYRPPTTPEQEPAPERPADPLQELETLNLDSRTGNAKAKILCDASYFDERQPMVREWFASLAKDFGIIVTHADAQRCKMWFERNNKSFLNPRHYTECRRWNAAAGYWNAWTSEEVVLREIENLETSRLTVQQRNELNRRVQQAREADLAKFGQPA